MGAALLLAFLWRGGDGAHAAAPPAVPEAPSVGAAANRPATTAPNPIPTSEGQDIRDIHGPVALPGRLPLVWFVASGLALVTVAGGLLYRYRRRPPLPPHQRALRALEEARTLLGGDPRMFSFTVSEIVRAYVEAAFALRAAHRTTEELLADLMRDQSPVASHRAALGQFLQRCDLAKFAGWSLSPLDMTAMLDSAEAFVRATSPDGAAPPAPMATSSGAERVLA